MESLIRAAPATPEPGARESVFISWPALRSTTAMASWAWRGTTATAPRVVMLAGCTSDAPRGTVETCVGEAMGIRLRVAAVVLSTTTTSSGGGKGAEVSAQDVNPARARVRAALRRIVSMAERSKATFSAASHRSKAEPDSSEDPPAPPGKSHHLVILLVEEILHPQNGGDTGAAWYRPQHLDLGGQIHEGIGRQLDPYARELIEVHVIPLAYVGERATEKGAFKEPSSKGQLRRMGRSS